MFLRTNQNMLMNPARSNLRVWFFVLIAAQEKEDRFAPNHLSRHRKRRVPPYRHNESQAVVHQHSSHTEKEEHFWSNDTGDCIQKELTLTVRLNTPRRMIN